MSWRIEVRPATDHDKARYGLGEGSDACVLVIYGGRIIGWADDYGTVHETSVFGPGAELMEKLVQAAVDCLPPNPGSPSSAP